MVEGGLFALDTPNQKVQLVQANKLRRRCAFTPPVGKKKVWSVQSSRIGQLQTPSLLLSRNLELTGSMFWAVWAIFHWLALSLGTSETHPIPEMTHVASPLASDTACGAPSMGG